MVQAAPGLTVAPQVFVWANGPEAAILVTVRIPRPVLLTVALRAGLVVKTVWFGKVRLAGENVTAGDTPVPLSGNDCGLPGALSPTEIEPVEVPFTTGVNVTLKVQLAPGFRVAPQVFVWANGPEATMLPIVRMPRPVLVSVAF